MKRRQWVAIGIFVALLLIPPGIISKLVHSLPFAESNSWVRWAVVIGVFVIAVFFESALLTLARRIWLTHQWMRLRSTLAEAQRKTHEAFESGSYARAEKLIAERLKTDNLALWESRLSAVDKIKRYCGGGIEKLTEKLDDLARVTTLEAYRSFRFGRRDEVRKAKRIADIAASLEREVEANVNGVDQAAYDVRSLITQIDESVRAAQDSLEKLDAQAGYEIAFRKLRFEFDKTTSEAFAPKPNWIRIAAALGVLEEKFQEFLGDLRELVDAEKQEQGA